LAAKKKSPHPTISPARREAFAILLEIDRNHGHSDDLLRNARVSALSAQDRNLCTTLVMGTLRWQIWLDAGIKRFLTKPNARLDPEIQVALRLGVFQLLFLDRIPAHAAIGESVALAKAAGHTFASGMVNAVLRKLSAIPKPEQNPSPSLTAVQLAEATAHPAWLVERWAENYGIAAARAICLHGQNQPELTLRLYPADAAALEAELAEQGIELQPGAILSSARRVVSGDVTATPAFQSGRVRIQEEGSQLIAELGGDGTRIPRRILDCCAAPGGKTLILAERNPQARITALEISPERCQALEARIAASTYCAQVPYQAQVEVQLGDAVQLSTGPVYDLILADVPCSGTGTLGRNPEVRHRLQPADLARHHQRQCGILQAALRAGTGRVIYSTCSLEPEENSAVVNEVLARTPGWRQIPISAVLSELRKQGVLPPAVDRELARLQAPDGSMMILPGSLGAEVEMDGFFIAILEKGT
jgi:16S rRNA (cytosine967-C5)-methyltransferase